MTINHEEARLLTTIISTHALPRLASAPTQHARPAGTRDSQAAALKLR